jgi:hypothetical protein
MIFRSASRWGSRIRLVGRCGVAIAAVAVASVAWGSPADAQASDWDLVAPQLECVTVNGNGTYTALFGTSNYTSWTLNLSHGLLNRVTPSSLNADPPESIAPGRQVGVFTVTQQVGQPIVYQLGFTNVRATSTSVPCTTAPQVAEAPLVVGLLGIAGAGAVVGYRRLNIASPLG